MQLRIHCWGMNSKVCKSFFLNSSQRSLCQCFYFCINSCNISLLEHTYCRKFSSFFFFRKLWSFNCNKILYHISLPVEKGALEIPEDLNMNCWHLVLSRVKPCKHEEHCIGWETCMLLVILSSESPVWLNKLRKVFDELLRNSKYPYCSVIALGIFLRHQNQSEYFA